MTEYSCLKLIKTISYCQTDLAPSDAPMLRPALIWGSALLLILNCYKASGTAGNESPTTGGKITASPPDFSVPSGNYNQPQNLNIYTVTPDALICYTISPGGTDPACDSKPKCIIGNSIPGGYSVQVQTGVLRAIACRSGYSASAVTSASYVFDNVSPGNIASLNATAGNAQVFLSWINPGSDFAGVKILRKLGSNPANPTDGTVIYTGTAPSYTDTGLVNLTAYYYTVFAYDAALNYSTGVSANAIPLNGPPGNASLGGVTPASGRVSFTWTNPGDVDFSGVKVLRKTTGFPANNTDGTAIYNGNATSYIDTALTNGTLYYYTFFAYDTALNYASGTNATATPSLAPITSFVATAGNQQVSLSWFNSSTSNSAGVRLLRKTGSTPANPTDGTILYDAAATPGSAGSFTDTSLTNGTAYYYAAYAYDAAPNFSTATTNTATPVIAPVTSFAIVGAYNQLSLSWTNPVAGNFSGVKILRKTGGYPTSPSDGATVYNGTGTSVTDIALPSNTLYYYRAYAYDTGTVYASGAPQTGTTNPVPNISGFGSVSNINQITLSWTNAVTANFSGVRIMRKTGSFPTGAADGILVYNGTGATVTDTGLPSGVTQFYAAFSYDAYGAYSSGVNLSASATNLPEISGLGTAPGTASMTLSWTNPAPGTYAGIRVLRKTSSFPVNATDGTVVYTGTGTGCVDTGIPNDEIRYYRVFTSDAFGGFSSGVSISAAAKPPNEIAAGWDKQITGNGLYVRDMKVDSAGNVYITGDVLNAVSPTSGFDWHIRKFDANGNEILVGWNKVFHSGGSNYDGGRAIVIDAADNVYVLGSSFGGGPYSWRLKKFAPDGTEDTVNWDKNLSYAFVTQPNAMAIDGSGNIYAVGFGNGLVHCCSNYDMWIRKFSAAGVEDMSWDKRYNAWSQNDSAVSVAIDAGGNVYVLSSANALWGTSSLTDWWIKKFTSAGTEITSGWDKKLDSGNLYDDPGDIAIDATGNVYVSGTWGRSGAGTDWRGLIKKYAANGVEDTTNWNKLLPLQSSAPRFAPVADGNIFVFGTATTKLGAATGYDLWLRKFSAVGAEDLINWDRKFDYASGDDYAVAIALGPTGKIHIAARSSLPAIIIKKFDP